MKAFCLIRNVALLLTVFSSLPAAATEVRTLDVTPDRRVELLWDVPTTSGPHPLVVLAPGQGYHARLPLLEALAKSLSSQGVAVLRFNWSYFVKDPKAGRPSAELVMEVSDMTAVLAEGRKSSLVDAARIAVAGKSLGSLVTWRVLHAQPAVKAGALLTPVCIDASRDTAVDNFYSNHPGIRTNSRPLLLISGDADPVCPLPILYANAARLPHARAVGVGGRHSFEVKTGPNAEIDSQSNLDLAVRITADFLVKALR